MLVLAVTAAQCLDITELWVAFGAGKSFRYLAAHEMAKALGSDRCTALPMLHAFTGCHRFWSGQEECMEYFDGLLRLSCQHQVQCHRRLDGSSGAICGIAV